MGKGGIGMSVFDDPGNDLQWLEDELLEAELAELLDEEEIEEEPRPRRTFRTEPETMADREALFVERKKKKKGLGKFKFLAFLEILAILAVIWWWIKWLY